MALPQSEINAMTPEEYLAFERASEFRHEYFGGEVYAMSGASEKHNLITLNIAASLHGQLRKRPCKVYSESMRVKMKALRSYAYPDVVALCGDPQFADDEFDMLLNPQVIIEVLSPSTEGYDKTGKFVHYRQLESLQEFLLVAQVAPHIEHYVRQTDGSWQLRDILGIHAQLTIDTIGCDLMLEDVYEKVSFAGDEANDE